MAKLLIIKAETEKDNVQYIGDVVEVYEDGHVFSDHELSIFNVLIVGGTADEVRARLDQITPKEEVAIKWSSDNLFHFSTEPMPEGVSAVEFAEVYQVEGSNRWYTKTTGFKFPVNVSSLTPEEKQLLETVDINHPSVDSFIRKLAKDITTQPGNDVEVKELRNGTP